MEIIFLILIGIISLMIWYASHHHKKLFEKWNKHHK